MKKVQNEKLFQELDNEAAASCTGGVLSLYENDNFQGRVVSLRDGRFNVPSWLNISALRIEGNERWAFYKNITSIVNPVILGRGFYNSTALRQRGLPNSSISSIRRIT